VPPSSKQGEVQRGGGGVKTTGISEGSSLKMLHSAEAWGVVMAAEISLRLSTQVQYYPSSPCAFAWEQVVLWLVHLP
jgi:hypothetical protein